MSNTEQNNNHEFKAYRVDFKFMLEDQASIYIIARNEEEAAAGSLGMLKKNEQQYNSPEVIKVEEYKKEPEPVNETLSPTLQ